MTRFGKPGKIGAPFIGCLAVIGIAFAFADPGFSGEGIRKGRGVEGFRELAWGATVEQASRIYRDLDFRKYAMPDDREEPSKIYVRRSEEKEMEGVAFDSIEYWFKGDRFFQAAAVLQSRVGPRTLVTRAEDAFGRMAGRLRDQYGEPSARKVDYVTEFIVVVKEDTWIVGRTAIIVKYEGAGTAGEDSFRFTLRERGAKP